MENPKVMILATMETFRFMDPGGGDVEGWVGRKHGGTREEVGRTEQVECNHVFKTPKTNAPLKGEKSGHRLIWMSSNIWVVGMMQIKHLEERPHFWLLFWTNVWASYGAQMCPRKSLAKNKCGGGEVGTIPA